MREYLYKLLNVFTETTFGGNSLCVFENADGLTNFELLQIAKQFNLPETVFLYKSDVAVAKLRIFTPNGELPFAGHPVLGAAAYLKNKMKLTEQFSVECQAGIIQVEFENNLFKLTTANNGTVVQLRDFDQAKIPSLLNIEAEDLASHAYFVDTGTEHLLIPVKDLSTLKKMRLDTNVDNWISNSTGRKTAYVFCIDQRIVNARYFSLSNANVFIEDPGTGSACANLGAWLLSREITLPSKFIVNQGQFIDRPSCLELELTEDRQIKVGGKVIEIGSGEIHL